MTLKDLVAKHRAALETPPPAPPAVPDKEIAARDAALIELEAARTAAVQERDFAQARAAELETELNKFKADLDAAIAAKEAEIAKRAEDLARDMVAAQGVPAAGLPAAENGADSRDQLIAQLRNELAAADPADGEKRGSLVKRIRHLQAQATNRSKN